MNTPLIEPMWAWGLFIVFVLTMILLDLKIFHRHVHEVSIREALVWSAVWIALAFAFNVVVYFWFERIQPGTGRAKAMEFLSGYLIEKSLSVDNLFVFLMIFSYFRVPTRYQHTILFWGIMGALVMRGLFIWAGTELVSRFEWIVYVFGVFLLWTGFKLFHDKDPNVDPEKSRVLRLVRRYVPLVEDYAEGRFFVRRDGRTLATMMFLVLVFVETTDVVFAVDSIPAILAITQDRFIVFTSNVFAIFGLRALFFALAGLMKVFHYLNYGLAVILCFVGLKMLLTEVCPISQGLALGVIGGVLALSVLASILWPAKEAVAASPGAIAGQGSAAIEEPAPWNEAPRETRLITGLDIGTTQIRAVIAAVDAAGGIQVLGMGSAPSSGLRRGLVTDFGQAAESVRKAYQQAISTARVTPREVLVGISGDHIRGLDVEAMAPVSKPDTGIDQFDCARAEDLALKTALPRGVEILHKSVKGYTIDERRETDNPIGLYSQNLQVRMHVVTSSISADDNLFHCIQKAGLKPSYMIVQPLANSLSVLTPDEREDGVILLDIGGRASEIAIFKKNNLQYMGEIPLGGAIVTIDVAKVLRCTSAAAEKLKIQFGHVLPEEISPGEMLDIPGPANGKDLRKRGRRELAEIIAARLEEIFLEIKKTIDGSGSAVGDDAGVVLTGGTALLAGIDEVAQRVLGRHCRIGKPQSFPGMGDSADTPTCSTAMGLIHWGVAEGPPSRHGS